MFNVWILTSFSPGDAINLILKFDIMGVAAVPQKVTI